MTGKGILGKIFGRRQKGVRQGDDIVAIARHGIDQSPKASADESVEINMEQVADYAEAMARHRGYPDDFAALIARRVVFLERRDLPGLGSLHRELHDFRDEPLASRFNRHRPDGSEGRHCPFYAGVELEASFDFLTSATPEESRWAVAPSNPLLFLPHLAEWLRPTGRRALLWWEKDKKMQGYFVVEGFRLAAYVRTEYTEAFEALRMSTHIGFSACPDDFLPEPKPFSGIRDKLKLQRRHIAMMEDFLSSSL